MSLYGALAEAERQGKEVVCVTAPFPANGQLATTTPFATIDCVHATINQAGAPTTSAITWDFTGGVLTVYGWMPTAAGNTALIASTAEEDVSITIIGRRRR